MSSCSTVFLFYFDPQIAIELHTGKDTIKKGNVVEVLTDLLQDLTTLFKAGFRSISYKPNLFVGKSMDFKQKYYTFFDIVLFKK